MNLKINAARNGRFLFIFIIPIFYFFAGLFIKLVLGDPSLRSIDPDYAYFISGLNIAEGIFKITHIDHPGTPLQYLIALVIRVIYLFRENPNMAEDVLGNSDLYLTAVNITITLLVAISLFAAARYVLKKTDSVLYAVLIQTVPFVNYIWYEIIGRITPELLMPIPIVALTALLVVHINSGKEKYDTSFLVTLSLILALGLSIKITLIPLLIIPLFAVRNWKSKMFVLALTLFFFLIIAMPATLQIERFWHWLKNLFLHSGSYGSGEKNVVDLNVFAVNLGKIIRLQKSFSYFAALLFIVSVATFIGFRNRLKPSVIIKLRVASGILAVIVLQALMVGKHYSPHYFIPAVMFTPLLIYLLAELIREFNASQFMKVTVMALVAVFILWNFKKQIHPVRVNAGAFQQQIEAREFTRNIAHTFEKESIKIIVSQDYGSPFVEYALHFSTVWSAAKARERYREILAGLFPNTYQFTTWDGKFIQWGEPFNPGNIADHNIPVYIYLEKNPEELLNQTLNKIFPEGTGFLVQTEPVFTNPVNGEALVKLNLHRQ